MFHTLSQEDAVKKLNTNAEAGLSQNEAAKRLTDHGPNAFPEAKKASAFVRLLHHFQDFLVLVLLAAAIFSFFIGEYKDGSVIIFIIVANAFLGFLQEAKADNAIAALKKLSVTNAKVIRDGKATVVKTEDLVPGDVFILENGDKIPADGRLLEAVNLKVSESSLTGESKPVEKKSNFLSKENVAVADRLNMVYKDTVVMFGRGKGVVSATGTNTEVGKIFQLLQKQESKLTALSKELNRVGKGLTLFAAVAAVLIFSSIWLSDEPNLKNAFLTSISMAIAVVPEGIPAVVTTVLAISVARLANSRAIVRKLDAVETLGSATTILTDKTGTLTKNEMVVTDIYLEKNYIKVFENSFLLNNKVFEPNSDSSLKWLLTCCILCNDAQISEDGKILGDPTEACLLVAAQKGGLSIKTVRDEFKRIFEIPFSSDTKRMTVVVKNSEGKTFVITKGACETVCPFIPSLDSTVWKIAEDLSANGIRNLVYSVKEVTGQKLDLNNEAALLEKHEYLGVVGMKDPLRPEVKPAVDLAKSAGVKTIMITGDHKLIARNIGMELGLVENDSELVDGTELSALEGENFAANIQNIRAFSRVSPEQKLKIVKAAMSRGETVIVTGDGVNDAPAIKTADIGVAMGITGTDVAKEAADLVLQDDNYSTIVEAIKQGRGIFNNFIKFLKYQISCNLSGVLIVFPITLLNFPTPLLPVHILLLNLISETGPSIALGLEKPEANIMNTKPRQKYERLLTKKRWGRIIFEAVLLAIAGIAAFFVAKEMDSIATTTAVLTTAFLSRLWHAFNSRSETLSVFSSFLQKNPGLYYTVAGTVLFLGLFLYTSEGNSIIKTVPLSPSLMITCFLLSLIPVLGVEILKVFLRRKTNV